MATAVGTLSINLIAKTGQFNQAMLVSQRRVQSFSAGIGSSLAMLGRYAAPAAIVGGITKITQANEQFNQSMTRSVAIMSGVDAKMRARMEQAARSAGQNTGVSSDEAAKSFYYLASAGLSAEQTIKAMPAVANFATAGMFDMARATDLLTDAQSALGLSVADAEKNLKNMKRVSDVLVKANTLANASVEQFSEALTNGAASSLKVVGKDVEEGVAVLAAFASQGVKGEEAGTALSIVMRDLQTKAIQNKQAFADMGVKVYDAQGKMQSLSSIIGGLEKALAGSSDEQQKTTLLSMGFADKSVKYIQAVLGMADAIKKWRKELENSKGATEEVAGKMQTEWEKGWKKFKEGGKKMLSPITQPIANAAGIAMGGVGNLMDQFNGYFHVPGSNRSYDSAEADKHARFQEFLAAQDAATKALNKRKAAEQKAAASSQVANAQFEKIDRQLKQGPLITAGKDGALGMHGTWNGSTWEEREKTLFGAAQEQALQKQQAVMSGANQRPVAALRYGSNETISAINRMRKSAESHESKMENLADDQKSELKKVNEKLSKIEDKLGNNGAVSL